jgi:hypothetical protein
MVGADILNSDVVLLGMTHQSYYRAIEKRLSRF